MLLQYFSTQQIPNDNSGGLSGCLVLPGINDHGEKYNPFIKTADPCGRSLSSVDSVSHASQRREEISSTLSMGRELRVHPFQSFRKTCTLLEFIVLPLDTFGTILNCKVLARNITLRKINILVSCSRGGSTNFHQVWKSFQALFASLAPLDVTSASCLT
jgi:hypothetical protein